MISLENLYHTLGLEESASGQEIKKKFRQLSKEYHPDLNQDDEEKVKVFVKILDAYQILSHSEKRRLYDQSLKDGLPFNYVNPKWASHENAEETEAEYLRRMYREKYQAYYTEYEKSDQRFKQMVLAIMLGTPIFILLFVLFVSNANKPMKELVFDLPTTYENINKGDQSLFLSDLQSLQAIENELSYKKAKVFYYPDPEQPIQNELIQLYIEGIKDIFQYPENKRLILIPNKTPFFPGTAKKDQLKILFF